MTVATATRTRRVRCTAGETLSGLQTTGCGELFQRHQIVGGLCSRCLSIEERTDANGQTFLAITEPVYIDEQERAQYQIGQGTETPACTFTACDGQGCQDDDPYSGHSPIALARLEATYPAETPTQPAITNTVENAHITQLADSPFVCLTCGTPVMPDANGQCYNCWREQERTRDNSEGHEFAMDSEHPRRCRICLVAHENHWTAPVEAPAETVTTHEVRCRTCPEWVADNVAYMNDGRCNDCHDRWMHEQDAERETAATETEEMARDEREAASQEAQRIIEEQMVTSVSETRAPLPAGWQPSVWQVELMCGSQVTAHIAAHVTFDEAQRMAKEVAKEVAQNYNSRITDSEDISPIRAVWRNVKLWEIGTEQVRISKIS